jgi:glucokinase
MSSVIGFDLGGTKSFIAEYDADTWELRRKEKVPTEAHRGWRVVLDDVTALIGKYRTGDVRAVGFGVPGLVRQPEGFLINAPNIPGAKHVALKNLLEERLELPVFLDNDANCFALAEARLGAGKGEKVVIGITVGTGVGGGIVVDGRLFRGAHGYAGEIGHMLLVPGEVPYASDDRRGTVEQYVSGTAMGKRCEEARRPEDYLRGQVCAFMQPHIFREVSWLCCNLTHAFDPSCIVFGGSTGCALKPHLAAVEKNMKEWLLPETPMPALAIGMLEDAATLGAALLCVEKI